MSEHRQKSKLTALFFVRDNVLPYAKCPPSYRSILLLLASYANPDGTRVFQSSRSISALLGFDRNTVREAIKFWLRQDILILVEPGNGRGHANEYAIRMEAEVFVQHSGENDGLERGEPFTPLERERGELDTHKGVNFPRERGEQRGEPFTPTESPIKEHRQSVKNPPNDSST